MSCPFLSYPLVDPRSTLLNIDAFGQHSVYMHVLLGTLGLCHRKNSQWFYQGKPNLIQCGLSLVF